MPAVSVLVALPGPRDGLAATVQSVLSQTLGDLECLIVGDAPTADDPSAAQDPRVRVIDAPGLDPTGRLNLGLMRASAPLVALIGPGCVASPDWLATLLDFLDLTGCAAIGCGHVGIAAAGARATWLPSEAGAVDAAAVPPRIGGLPLPLLLARRDALLAAGGFQPCPGAEDLDLAVRLGRRVPIWNLPETLGRVPAAAPPDLSRLRLRAALGVRSALATDDAAPLTLDKAASEAGRSLEAAVALASVGLAPALQGPLALGAGLAFVDSARRAGVTLDLADVAWAQARLAEGRGRLSVRDADAAIGLLRGGSASPAPFRADAEVIVYNGIKLAIEPGVIAGRLQDALQGGWYELEESRNLPGLLRPGERVIELGSGLGYVTTTLARNPNVEAVVTIEANPQLSGLVAQTVALNGVADKVTVCNGVAMPSPTVAAMPFYVRHEFWASSLDGAAPHVRAITVPVVDLDTLIAEFRPTLLVIDIEGGEVDLLERTELGTVRKVFAEVHQGPIGRQGMARVFGAMAARHFHYDQYHSEGSVVLFSRIDLPE